MITKETLEAVSLCELTDSQLNEAIEHYEQLEKDLKCHGEIYHLVWKDVFFRLLELNNYKSSRDAFNRLNEKNKHNLSIS